MTRKTDGGKGDRIPGANQSAYEAGYDRIQWLPEVPADTQGADGDDGAEKS